MNNVKIRQMCLVVASALYLSSLGAIDNAHFWKVARFHGDPTTAQWEGDQRYETADWLSKADFTYAYGSATKGWNNRDNKTSLLNIYGNQDMRFLFSGVTTQPNELNYAEFLGRAVNRSQTNSTFGHLRFKGRFELHEVNFDFRQNFVWGLFAEVHLPIRNMTVKDIRFEDLSPETGMFSKMNPDWKRLLNNFDRILENHGFHPMKQRYNKTDVGDLSILVGWDHIDQETFDWLKWIRASFKFGGLFPTGENENPSFVFSLPTGYNEHWGIPIHGQLEFGVTDWLSLGTRAGAIFFFDKTMTKRLKTHKSQSGIIKLAQGKVEEEKGTVWYIGGDITFDHVFKGFSFLFGYSFNKGENNDLHPRSTCCVGDCCTGLSKKCAFSEDIINTDAQLNSWWQHVLHFAWDYDFSVHDWFVEEKYAPRVSFFYNLPFEGKNAFDTDMIGGGIGVDFRWDF